MTLAFAIAVALHEIVAGAIPPSAPQNPPREIVSRARLLHVTHYAIASPTPKPAPQPTFTPAPVRSPQIRMPVPLARAATRLSARAAVHRSVPRIAKNARPVWDVGVAAGGTIVAAAGQAARADAGTAPQGNGGAAQGGPQPCGFVTFSDPHGSHFDRQTRGFWVDIRMSVHFADGSSQSMMLDYPWYYPSEAANPWSDENLRDPNFPTRFQAPPAAKLDVEPDLVKYVAQHSTPDGMTLLRNCPAAAAPSR